MNLLNPRNTDGSNTTHNNRMISQTHDEYEDTMGNDTGNLSGEEGGGGGTENPYRFGSPLRPDSVFEITRLKY